MAVMPVNYYEGNPNVKIVGYIYETDDYDMFKKMDGNRNIEKIGKLKASMRKNGFMNCPALINENGEISDGQNRIESAKELNIPVKFVVQPGVRLSQTIDLNTGQKNWSSSNFLHSHSVDSTDCIRFEQLMNAFPNCGARVVYAVISGSITGGGVEALMKNGTIRCSDEEYRTAYVILKWLSSFDDLIKQYKVKGSKKSFYLAVLFTAKRDFIDVQTLAQRIRNNFDLYGNRFADIEATIAKTEEVYNYKVPKNNRIYLMDEYRKALNASAVKFRKRDDENDTEG